MVEVRLHGPLAKAFGQKWMLDIRTPGEAIHAIEANKPGIRRMIRDLASKGLVFRVRTKSHDYGNEDVHNPLGSASRVDIIPIVRGAGAGLRFVIGAVLIAVGAFVTVGSDGAATPFGKVLITTGISLMLGSVVEWLTPIPKPDSATENKQSWTLNGPTNTADQGSPVPIIYGEVLTGGYPISAGISPSQVNIGGTLDPDVDITGNRNPRALANGNSWSAASSSSVELVLSALPINISEPYTYAWSYSLSQGYQTAITSVTSVAANQATFRLKVKLSGQGVTGANSYKRVASGTVTLTITGLEQDRAGAGAPAVLTKSRTVPVSLMTSAVHGRL